MSEPVVLVRSRVLKGWAGDERVIAEAAVDLESFLRADARGLGVVVDLVGDASVEDDGLGAWVRVTRTATGHRRS